jgi:Hint domain
MPNVDWTDPGSSDNWSVTANWAGLVGEAYPGQFAAAGDIVTIGASNSAYVVTFDVPSATISSLTIEGGNGTPHDTILQMTADNTLIIQGGVTLFKKDSNAAIDGAGTISVGGGITAAGATASEGFITAGTDTTGGVLDLTGTGFITTPFVFSIGTAAPSTLEFDLQGGVSSTTAITINNVNQTLEVGPSGALVIGATQNVTNGTILMAGGTLTDLSGISFGTNSSRGSLSGFGTVTGALTGSGTGTNTITASDGSLVLSTAIGFNSGLLFTIGSTAISTLELDNAPGAGNSFTFEGSAGALALTGSAASRFDDTIVGLNVGNTLSPTNLVDMLGSPAVTVDSGQLGFGDAGEVVLSDGAVLNLTGITNGSGNVWHVLTTPDKAGTGTDVFLSLVCYAAGTRILTATGERVIESLLQGDIVLTLSDGELKAQPVKWVGRRRIDLTAHPRPETVAPVRVQRGAFADNMPHTDLLLSPDHAVFVDGKLICIRQLVNGSTIRIEHGWTSADYFHVELDAHAILLAEGLPAESYLDTGNRGFFANSGAPLVLHPDLTNETDYPTREAGSCAPFVWDEASVRPVWQHLADRAAAIGRPVPQRATTTDADLRLLADRHPVKPVFSDDDRAIFVLPRGAREVRLVSRAQSPTEARPWLEDRRHLGVRVKRIVLRGADELREVPVDHPDLTRGWWAVERDGQIMSRWTDGEAVLPLPSMSGNVMLEIHLAGSMIYAVNAAPEDGTERRAAA